MFPWPPDGSPLRFDRFMEAALHDPERGYYRRRIREVGRAGDFSTSASLSPVLGRAIGHWAAAAMKSTGCRDLIELGPGSGELAEAILAALPWHQRIRVRFHLVETSEPLRKVQAERLGNRVRWHHSAVSALSACDGAACIYSNEFVDAFPVRRFKNQGGQWLEEFVTPGASQWQPAGKLPPGSVFGRDWDEGQVVEVHASYHEWLNEVIPHWKSGRMLTIDYGQPVHDLHHRRPAGSLRGYFHHQLVTGPELLERPGYQDLTADVNFTDLIEWPKPRLNPVSCLTQSDFLSSHIDAQSPADGFLAHAGGAGGAFLCLDQVVAGGLETLSSLG
jgi:SAM-dependent MidA family methyltransferase